MTPESAIRTIDDHLVWLAKRGMINNAMLKKLTGALKVLAGYVSEEQADAVTEAEFNSYVDAVHRLKLLLRVCGFTEKGIEEASKLRHEFLEKWAAWAEKTKNYLQFSLMYDMLLTESRQLESLARSDLRTVREYYFLFRMKKNLTNVENEFKWYKEEYPHLNVWFTRIDEGNEMDGLFLNERAILEKSYQTHLSKWN
jgi:hypothetical protein